MAEKIKWEVIKNPDSRFLLKKDIAELSRQYRTKLRLLVNRWCIRAMNDEELKRIHQQSLEERMKYLEMDREEQIENVYPLAITLDKELKAEDRKINEKIIRYGEDPDWSEERNHISSLRNQFLGNALAYGSGLLEGFNKREDLKQILEQK